MAHVLVTRSIRTVRWTSTKCVSAAAGGAAAPPLLAPSPRAEPSSPWILFSSVAKSLQFIDSKIRMVTGTALFVVCLEISISTRSNLSAFSTSPLRIRGFSSQSHI
uniref:Uncharacterized protein n=1 Tax=Anguilla anguilla TaxID=7936 RepID=A0A0E9VIM3_ANGAN